MDSAIIFVGGIYTVALIIFHSMFWRIFDWPASLRSLSYVNRATMQVLNVSITFIFGIFAYISFFHADELLHTGLGRSLLILISCLWFFRAGQQVVFYKLKRKASIGLSAYFLVGALLYGVPAVI